MKPSSSISSRCMLFSQQTSFPVSVHEQNAKTTRSDSHKWVMFIHGLSKDGENHGSALKKALTQSTVAQEWNFFSSKACTSFILPYLTLNNTMRGLDVVSGAVLEEIVDFFGDKPIPTHISIIGASYGGVVARQLAFKLNQMWVDVHFESLVLVASPTLGKLGVATPTKWSKEYFFNMLSLNATKEMHLVDTTNWLSVLGTEPTYLDTYSKFRKRLIYAPVWNDNIVAYESASLLGVVPLVPINSINENPLVSCPGRVLTVQDSLEAVAFADHESSGGGEVAQKVSGIQRGMMSCGWTLYDVNTNHRLLATLRASERGDVLTGDRRGLAAKEIAEHIVSQIIV